MSDGMTVEYMLSELQAGDPGDGNFYVKEILALIGAERCIASRALRALREIDSPELETLIGMCKEGSDVYDVITAMQRIAHAVVQDGVKKHKPGKLQALVDEQAKDDGLWFEALTAPEAYLQQELRRLHKAIEEGG